MTSLILPSSNPCISKPDIIFVNPQLGENIGSAARGLLNFGFTNIILVNPREGWLTSQAIARSSGAGNLLSEARIYPDLESAIANYTYVFATTIRSRGLSKPVVSLEKAMNHADQIIQKRGQVAFLLGPERTGLTNRDIIYANDYVSIATNPDFSSINLAHCALLLAYEWNKLINCKSTEQSESKQTKLAPVIAKLTLAVQMIDDLKKTDYFRPKNRKDSMEEYLKNLFIRLDLTDGEVKTLHRIRKALQTSNANNID